MLIELVDDYVAGNNVVVSSASKGSTSLSLFIANVLAGKGNLIIYYNPTKEIDRSFIRDYYINVYNNVVWAACNFNDLLQYLELLNYSVDYLVLDPGDSLLNRKNSLIYLSRILKTKGAHLICTSQIRINIPTKRAYSTLERYMGAVFNYSIWIRTVTETSGPFENRYVDVFNDKKSGNNYIGRYVAKFSKDGYILA